MKTRFSFRLIVALILLITQQAQGQATAAADYYFYSKSSTYSYLSGGTSISSVESDDALSSSISIGFTFKFCGTDYTNIYVSSNGWITFGSSPYLYAYPGTTSYLGSSSGIGAALMPLWDDLSGDAGTATYTSTGSSPNRVFTVEFKEWLWDYSTSTAAISMQVKLFEGTNVIQYIYKRESGVPDWYSSPGATIGIAGGSSTDYLSLSDASTSPTASSTSLTNTIRSKPNNGQIYEFSPSPQCDGTPSAYTPKGPDTKVCSGVSFTLLENVSTASIGKTYQWQSRPAGIGSFTNISGATSSGLTTSITANTDYRLIATCTASGFSSTSSVKTIQVLELPKIDSSGSTSFCSNQLFYLSSTKDTTYKYEWIPISTGTAVSGETKSTFSPTLSDKYTLKISTSSCLSGTISADTINVNVKAAPNAAINPGTTITICSSDFATLTGTGTGDYQWLNTGGIITGETGTSLYTNLGDDYTLEITNTSNGCKDTSAVTTVISSPAPTVTITPGTGANVCTGLSITLKSITTGSGISYQWINSAGVLTGATDDTLQTFDAEDYQLIVKAGTCRDTSNISTITLLPLPLANINSAGTTTAICPYGTDLKLQANAGTGYTYQWIFEDAEIPSATNREYSVLSSGYYQVKVTDAYGCIQYSDSFETFNTPAQFPKTTPSELDFCEGNIVNLYAIADPYYKSYQWYKGGTLLSGATLIAYPTSASGIYTVAITDSFNCTSMSSGTPVTVNPLPSKPDILKIGATLSTAIAYSSYQWYRNGKALAGATSRNYYILFDGIYTVEVSNSFGCTNISDELDIQSLGVNEIQSSNTLKVYPNPAKDMLHINYPEAINVSVSDMQGKVIFTGQEVTDINISQWADGIYLLTIKSLDGKLIGIEKLRKYNP